MYTPISHGITNPFILHVLGNFWNTPIPGREAGTLKNLPVKADSFKARPIGGVAMTHAKSVVGFLSHFIDRGLFSKQPYMGENCNHRDCKVSHWSSVQGDKRFTMIQSIVDIADDSCYFDAAASMCVYFHGVEESKNFDNVKLRSPMQLNFAQSMKYSYARNRALRGLSGKDFIRLCNFFGYRWVDSAGNPRPESDVPTFEDLMSICSLFLSYEFGTHEGFAKFYEDFGFDTVFSYEESEPVWKIHEMFGVLLRSLVPVRMVPFDGQHRILLMMLFMTGYLLPSTDVPLQQIDWAQSKFNEMEYSALQCFSELVFIIGIPMQDVRQDIMATAPKTIQTKLFDAANLLTEAAFHEQDVTWFELFQKWLEGAFGENNGFRNLTFQNYWCRDNQDHASVRANGELLWNALVELLDGQPRFNTVLWGKIVTEEKKMQMKEALEESLKRPESMSKNTTMLVYTRELAELFRCAVESKEGRVALTSFFSASKPCHFQRTKNVSDNLALIQNGAWLRRYVFQVSEKVLEHAFIRFQLERHLITLLRQGSAADTHLVEGMEKLQWDPKEIDKWPTQAQFEDSAISVAGVKKIVKNDSKAGTVEKMFTHGFMSGIVVDILRTIQTYGFDPDFLSRPIVKQNYTTEQLQEVRQLRNLYASVQKQVIIEFLNKGYTQVNAAKDPCLLQMEVEIEDEEAEDEGEDPKTRKVKYHCHFDIRERFVEEAKSDEEKVQYRAFLSNIVTREYLRYVRIGGITMLLFL